MRQLMHRIRATRRAQQTEESREAAMEEHSAQQLELVEELIAGVQGEEYPTEW